MKTMTCRQLGGACDEAFQAETFEEMAELSKEHATEMFRQGDQDHLSAAEKMQALMQNPAAMQEWFQSRREEFDNLPEE